MFKMSFFFLVHPVYIYIYTLREYIELYRKRSTTVFVTLLDASKAFDRLDHWQLFKKLINRKVPLFIVMLLLLGYYIQLYKIPSYLHIGNNYSPIQYIYIDLSKAFDMIDHNILLFKLHHYGIRNGALNLLKSYFTGRKQYCHFKNNDSSLLNIHKGVLQGSILGPLFFILYINDFIYSSDRFEFLMYAGDTTLFSTYDIFENIDDKTIETIQTNINKELFLIVSIVNKLSHTTL